MNASVSVLIVGLIPELVDFTPFPGMNAEKVRAGIASETARLNELGYAARSCLVDLGQTAEAVLAEELSGHDYACVAIGAGVRVPPPHLQLFEKLLNIVHEKAPRAKICFNTNPNDTVDAVRRWV